LTPARAAGKNQQLRGRIQKNSQARPTAHIVTGSGSYALLTVVALMGADERKLQIRMLIRWPVCIYRGNGGQFGPVARIEYVLIADL
jgi:vacuolar-type H+-ATPase catalytic subunit A/Vma1